MSNLVCAGAFDLTARVSSFFFASSVGRKPAQSSSVRKMKEASPKAEPKEEKTDERLPIQLRLQSFLNNQFGKVGLRVAKAPLTTIIITVIMAFSIATPFFVDTNEENRQDKLWVPDDSTAQDDR